MIHDDDDNDDDDDDDDEDRFVSLFLRRDRESRPSVGKISNRSAFSPHSSPLGRPTRSSRRALARE
jgi:hypothetical protein